MEDKTETGSPPQDQGKVVAQKPQMPWLDHYPPGVDWAEDIAPHSLVDLFDESVQNNASRPCIDFYGAVTRYRDLGRDVARLTAALQRRGIGRGHRVGLLLPNCPTYVTAYYAILKAGAVVVNLNPLTPPRSCRRWQRKLALPPSSRSTSRWCMRRPRPCSERAAVAARGRLLRAPAALAEARDVPAVPAKRRGQDRTAARPRAVLRGAAAREGRAAQGPGDRPARRRGAASIYRRHAPGRPRRQCSPMPISPPMCNRSSAMSAVASRARTAFSASCRCFTCCDDGRDESRDRHRLLDDPDAEVRSAGRGRPAAPQEPTILPASRPVRRAPAIFRIHRSDLQSLDFCISGGASLPAGLRDRFKQFSGAG